MLFTGRTCGNVSRVALIAVALLWFSADVNAQSSARSKPASQSKPAAQAKAAPTQSKPSSRSSSVQRGGPRLPAFLTADHSRSVRTFVPSHQRAGETSVRVLDEDGAATAEEVEAAPEELMSEPDLVFEEQGFEPVMSDCGCTGPCSHQQACLIPCPTRCWEHLELFGGAHGFTGPVNRGETGSFGFHEGVNWGAPVPCLCTGELGMQFGMRAAHSNFSGAESTGEERSQIFVTGGVFRRVDWGFQGGVVVDYLKEDWYLEADLVQLRGELSWVYPCRHEIGFWFTSNTQHDTVSSRLIDGTAIVTTTEELQATDLYAFFYRHRIDENGTANGRIFAGFTGESDGLIGADLNVPLNDCWAVQSSFAYLIPEESSRSSGGHIEESWNFALGLAWRPGGGFLCGRDYYRPLFDVAGNGTFMVDRD